MPMTFLMNLIRDVRGTSAVELGLILSLIVLAMLTALQGFGTESTKMWTSISTKVQTASNN